MSLDMLREATVNYFGQPPWQGMPQGFGGTPSFYPVYIPQTTPDGKPPSTKPMSYKRMMKQMMESQKAWEEFQKSGKKEEKKDDKPKVPMYSTGAVLLFMWATCIPVGLFSLFVYINLAKAIGIPIGH